MQVPRDRTCSCDIGLDKIMQNFNIISNTPARITSLVDIQTKTPKSFTKIDM